MTPAEIKQMFTDIASGAHPSSDVTDRLYDLGLGVSRSQLALAAVAPFLSSLRPDEIDNDLQSIIDAATESGYLPWRSVDAFAEAMAKFNAALA